MRSADYFENYRQFTCAGPAHRYPSPAELLRTCLADTATHRVTDTRHLTELLACADTTVLVNLDVAGVAAERTYLADLFTELARHDPSLHSAADSIRSLARRW